VRLGQSIDVLARGIGPASNGIAEGGNGIDVIVRVRLPRRAVRKEGRFFAVAGECRADRLRCQHGEAHHVIRAEAARLLDGRSSPGVIANEHPREP